MAEVASLSQARAAIPGGLRPGEPGHLFDGMVWNGYGRDVSLLAPDAKARQGLGGGGAAPAAPTTPVTAAKATQPLGQTTATPDAARARTLLAAAPEPPRKTLLGA
jgi:hypothetical protein